VIGVYVSCVEYLVLLSEIYISTKHVMQMLQIMLRVKYANIPFRQCIYTLNLY
jgi:hypothetical protein